MCTLAERTDGHWNAIILHEKEEQKEMRDRKVLGYIKQKLGGRNDHHPERKRIPSTVIMKILCTRFDNRSSSG